LVSLHPAGRAAKGAFADLPPQLLKRGKTSCQSVPTALSSPVIDHEWRVMMGGALEGIRVLELARFQAGPRGGMILSDLGAEVIKIEKLGGEETRKSPPLVRGQSVYFSVYNRGKKSLCLDLRTERGKEVFAALVKTADIVLQNFRPGVMDKMGFGYKRLCELKPDIILGSVSAFGQYGPYRERPGFDPLGQAMSGLMSLTGMPVGQPLGTASSIVDRYTSLHATIGMLAALHHRDRTGEGQEVDVCLMDSGLTMVEIPTSYYLATGQEGGEGGRPPYKAKDGHVVISASGREMARARCRSLLEVRGVPAQRPRQSG
jgi:formyl-CoA transferase